MKNCSSGKTFNPATKRCRKTCVEKSFLSRGKCLKPCATGKIRHPVTRRCGLEKNVIHSMTEMAAHSIINDYMKKLGDEDHYDKAERDRFCKIALKRGMSKNQIIQGLREYNKDEGVFMYKRK